MKIQTVNQLISVFKDISTRHYQINGFGIGDDWENGASEAKMHPVLWINPTTATMPSSDNGYKTFEIDFEVRVFDLVNKDESNENEVLSDCIDILKDIITEFKGHPYYVNSQLNIIDDINFEAFTEEFDEEVSGWVCEISLMTPVLTSFCGIPSAEITGFEFPGADCPEVNVLCPVFVEDVTGVYPIVVTTTGTTKEVSIVGGGLSDTFVISGEYDNGTLTLTRNDNVDVIVTGFDTGDNNDYTTSATLSGNIITFDRTDTVGAYSVDLTSAINSAPDKFVNSGAFDDASKLLTLTLNDATDFDIDFSTLTTADKFVSSGAYDAINNKIVLTLNDSSTVDIDTSAIGGGGGGNTIYTSNDTIGAGRVATLTDTLRFKDGFFEVEGTGIGGNTILSLYNGNTTPYKLWDFLDNGNVNLGVTFLSVGNSNTRTAGDNVVLLGNGLTVNDGKSVTIGSNGTTTSEYAVNIGYLNSVTGTGTAIGSGSVISGNASHSIGSDNVLSGVGSFGLGARISSSFSKTIGIGTFVQSSANGASAIGYGVNSGTKLTNSTANSLALGWNSATPRHVLGDSLAELGTPTTIKGIGTAGSSALTIYDNDTTPNKVFEVLDDSTIKTNGNAGFNGTGNYTTFTIENGIITNAS